MKLKDALEFQNGFTLTTGGIWQLESYIGQPSPITLVVDAVSGTYVLYDTIGTTDNPDVTFSIYSQYVFRYTVTCGTQTSTSTLVVKSLTTQPSDDCGSSLNLSYPTFNGEISITEPLYLCQCAIEEVIEAPASTVQNPPTWPVLRNGDEWFSFTTNSNLQLRIKIDGINNALLALYSGGCGLNSFTMIHNQAGVGTILTTPYLTLLPNTLYRLRVASVPFTNPDCQTFSISLNNPGT